MINLSETYTYEGRRNWQTGKQVTAQRKIKTGDAVKITFLGASEENIHVETYNGPWDIYDNLPAIGENYYFEVIVNEQRTYYGKYAEYRYTAASVGTGGVTYGSDHDCIDEEQVRSAFGKFKEWLRDGAKNNNYWHGLYAKKDFPETIAYCMPGEVVEPVARKAAIAPPGVVVEEGDGVFSVDGIRYDVYDTRDYSGEKVVTVKAARVLHSDYAGRVEIPARVMYRKRWRTVIQIDDDAFCDCPDLVEVWIPATVEWIRGKASGSPALTAIHIDKANKNYTSIDGVVYNKEKTEIICYPEGHGDSFEIPSTVKSIGNEFNGCTVLRSIVIPGSVTRLRVGAFKGCTGLKELYVPGSIQCIETDCFDDCSSLESLTIEEGVQSLESAFAHCSSLRKVILPDTLNSAKFTAFAKCDAVEEIRFPKGKFPYFHGIPNKFYPWGQEPFFLDGVYYEPYYDHTDQTPLVRVANIPKDQQPQPSFPGIETLVIPPIVEQHGFTYVVTQFWCNCAQFPNLRHLELPETIIDFRDTICGLKEYVVDENNQTFSAIDGVLYSKDQRKLISVPMGMSPETFVVRDGVEVIAEKVFMDFHHLKEVVLGASVRVIESHAFDNCTSLCKVHFNSGLQKIGSMAFHNTALESVELPTSLKDICQRPFSGGRPFDSCLSLKEFKIEGDNGSITAIDGVLYEKSSWGLVLIYCPPGYAGKLVIPDGVYAIGDSALCNAVNIEAVEMPDSVKRISSWALAGCKSLKEVVLSRELQNVGSCAFRECPSLKKLDFTRCRHYFGYDGVDTSAFADNPQLELILPEDLEKRRQYFEREMNKKTRW